MLKKLLFLPVLGFALILTPTSQADNLGPVDPTPIPTNPGFSYWGYAFQVILPYLTGM